MMGQRVDTAVVSLWGVEIGGVTWDQDNQLGIFEYMPDFIGSGIEVAPLMMPLGSEAYSFRGLEAETFKRLPGMLADVLPDKFGSALIDQWLVREGIKKSEFSPVDRLCYIGNRGMGALDFSPSIDRKLPTKSHSLDIDAMVEAASRILTERESMTGELVEGDDGLNEQTLADILHVGTSAGGARAKAVIAWNKKTNEVKSGQLKLPKGFEHWLIKFDGVTNNRDKELADSKGYGKMEYAYYRMALDAGIEMSESRLFEENGRHHFMTKRFDRTTKGKKLHMQSLCAMEHFDFNMPGAYSYEQAMNVVIKLGLGKKALEQLFLRAVFNVMARNQDDHVKNIAFLMDTTGEWKLAPAFDLTYAYNPNGEFTSSHQMTLNGKQDNFDRDDLYDLATRYSIPVGRARDLIEQVKWGVMEWDKYAEEAGVDEWRIEKVRNNRRIISG